MRDIKFRGKRLDNDEWVYGDLLKDGDTDVFIATHYTILDGFIQSHAEAVCPETVGQYTGFMDRKGKPIFEGDIIGVAVYQANGSKRLAYKPQYSVVEWHVKGGAWGWLTNRVSGKESDISWFATFDTYADKEIEVLSNVHDNPDAVY